MANAINKRFFISIEDDIKNMEEASTSKNTKKSAKSWYNIFKKWAEARSVEPKIELCPPFELNLILKKFYTEIRKENGKEYEPNCLRVMISSLDR